MKDFNEFLSQLSKNQFDLMVKSAMPMSQSYQDGIGLSKEDIELVTEIAFNVSLAVLSNYNSWISQDS